MTTAEASSQASNNQRVQGEIQAPSPAIPIGLGLLGLVGVYLAHRWSQRRDAINRRAVAAVAFRSAINTAAANMPNSVISWANLEAERLTDFLAEAHIAVNNFSPHLKAGDRLGLQRQWQELERHCKSEIPAAMKPAERIYNNDRPQRANKSFRNHVQKLLLFAEQA